MLRIVRHRETTPYPTASASGVIVSNEGLDKTVVRGEAKLSAWHLVYIAAALVAAIVLFNLPGDWGWLAPCFSLLVAVYSFLMWTIHFDDRSRLIRLIREASRGRRIANNKSGKKKKRNSEEL
jgi:hypothetical protein